VASPMRRTILLGLFMALLLAPAAHADGTTIKIIRDCADDGVLEGHYTPSELRKARDNLPTDVEEYSDCGDVLSRALAAGASSPGGGSGGGGGGTGGGTPAGGSPAAGSAPQYSDSTASPPTLSPNTPAESQAITDAVRQGGQGDAIAGRPLAPAADITGHFGRNSLPGSLIAVLVLLAGAAVSLFVPAIRRRVSARRAP
jgi:hypothetical protein